MNDNDPAACRDSRDTPAYTTRKRNFSVRITPGDRRTMSRRHPGAPLTVIDCHAVALAAGRQAFMLSHSLPEALDSLTASIPEKALVDWMKGRLKRAAYAR